MLSESLERFSGGGLDQSVGPTKLVAGAATIAKNVDVYPIYTVNKRQGYTRAQELAMIGAVVCRFEFNGFLASVDETGNIDVT